MRSKGEMNLLCQRYHKIIETHSWIQVLRRDNGGDYQSYNLHHYLEPHRIIHQTTCPNTPHQNGIVERNKQHFLEVVFALLIQAHIPVSYWGEALIVATDLINKVPTSSLDYQVSFQTLIALSIPNLSSHVLECAAFVYLHLH